ncbi:hypothetical protein ABZ721_31565 [Streptomyces sp. NPDC006733]|uniref:hypothetical protein n=1 Tax=Streptomyces sp. NPDC006733 TaxID=3155460 RepID=UPI0033F5DD4B
MAPESGMTAFRVFAPAVLDRSDHPGCDSRSLGRGGRDLINPQGMHPAYETERQFIDEQGPQAF